MPDNVEPDMVDPYGFMRYAREDPDKQRARQRVRHWHEYEQIMPDGQTRRQANRCIDCGTPYCHRYCPVHNLVPDWNELAGDNQWLEAFRQLDSTNNFPEFTGRLCPAPCEDACTLRLTGNPVSIRAIELAVAERAWQRNWIRPVRHRRRLFKRISIVGSGPAGLACAQQLARAGYRITVFEQADRIGGLLRYGIPDFRLEKTALDRRLAQLESEGVAFRPDTGIGEDLPIDELRRASHAVVLACGSQQPRDVNVRGRHLAGIHFAMDFLSQQNRRVAGDPIGTDDEITATGKDVVVIGGGDTGADCVGTAIRQGARRIVQIQYHEQPSVDVDILQYWPQKAPVLQTRDHDEEGCEYIWGWETVAFEGQGARVAGLVMQRLQWRQGDDGSWQSQAVTGKTRHLDAQLVLLATGYEHPLHDGPVRELDLKLDARGNIAATEDDYKTSTTGVFACGDMRRGQSLVVWAIREGRQCARAVDVWLSGDSDLPRI